MQCSVSASHFRNQRQPTPEEIELRSAGHAVEASAAPADSCISIALTVVKREVACSRKPSVRMARSEPSY
jgi:hypothetical protein